MPKRLLFLTFCVLPLASSLPAAVVTWGSSTAAVGPAEVDNTYTVIAAESGYTAPLTVNGVTFDPINTVNAISIDATADHYQFGTFNSGNVSYDRMIEYGYYTFNSSLPNNITFSGLMVGQAYQIQLWVGPWNGTFPTSFTAGNTVDMGNAHNVSKWVKGTFTADAGTQIVTYHGTGGSGYGIVAAVALSAIPEPSTFALLGGVAALGLALVAKRRLRSRAA